MLLTFLFVNFFHFCLSKNPDQPSGKQQIAFYIINHIMLFEPNNKRLFRFKFNWIDQKTFRSVLTQLLYALYQNRLVFSCQAVKMNVFRTVSGRGKNKAQGTKSKSRSSRAGLQFPVSRIIAFFEKAIMLSELVWVNAEVLELVGNAA